ncbi:MAG: hypothetical protein P8Y45_22175 [Exilibacterium sp.]
MLQKKFIYGSLYFIAIFLTACASFQPEVDTPPTVTDGVACIGSVDVPPAGVIESNNNGLLQKVLGAAGEGKLCEGKVFEAKQAVTVYRALYGPGSLRR